MKNVLFCCAALPLLACACWAAQKPALTPDAGGQAQRFVVVHSRRFIAGTENLTNAEANCSIQTVAGAASMECHPGAVTAKTSFHYNAALIVDGNGEGYVIACRNSLVAFWCKDFAPRTVIVGNLTASNLALSDGDKVHDYAVLTSGYVGLSAVTPAPQVAAAPAAAPAATASGRASRSAAAAPAGAAKGSDTSVNASGGSSAECASATAACVSFFSEPAGADIYVDGKFVGDTPSMLVLPPGSHEIRMEETNRKPWTRTLETGSGGNITLRATFDAATQDK